MSATRWLRFSADGLEVMVAASSFRRSVPAPAPLPEHVEVAGERYPLAALSGLSAATPAPGPPQLLLLLAEGDARLAIPATDVAGIVEAAAGDLLPLPWPFDREAPWCAGVRVAAQPPDRPVLVLDLAGLLRCAAADRVGAGEVAG